MPRYLKQLRDELQHQNRQKLLLIQPKFWLALLVLVICFVIPFWYWMQSEQREAQENLINDSHHALKTKIKVTQQTFGNFGGALNIIAKTPDLKEAMVNNTPLNEDTIVFLKNFLNTFKRSERITLIRANGSIKQQIYKELGRIIEVQDDNLGVFEFPELLSRIKISRPNYLNASPLIFEKKFNNDDQLRVFSILSMPIFDDNGEFLGAVNLKINHDLRYKTEAESISRDVFIQHMDIYNGDWFVNERSPELSLINGRAQTGHNVADDMPELWQAMSTLKSGHYIDRDGIYVFESILPFAISSPENTTQWRFDPSLISQYQYIFVNFTPRETYINQVNNQLNFAFLVLLFVLSVLIAGIYTTRGVSTASIKNKNRQLNDMLELNDAIIDNLGAALISIDKQGIITRFSRHAEIMFGYRADEVEGSNVKLLMRGDIAAKHDEYLSDYVKDTNAGMAKIQSILGKTRVLIAKDKAGAEFPVEIVVTKVPFGDTYRFVGLITDISQRLSMQNELAQALQQAEEANKYKSTFLAQMSHEIRTPMSGIYGTLQLLRARLKDSAHHDLIEKSIYSCKSLLGIINDILDISKIEANKIELENIPFNFIGILDETISELKDIAQQKGLEIIINGQDTFIDGWEGDPLRVKQILTNLCSNAVKFTHNGSVTISLTNALHDGLQFAVTDTGIGMSQEQLTRLFKPYEQASKSTSRHYGGTGLGMTICLQLVSLMNGNIDVTSVEGKGSKLQVTLPLRQKKVAVKEDIYHAGSIDLTGHNILLVEDNLVNQTIFEAMIEDTHANLRIASNGLEALEIVKSYDPEIIFMDIQMPELDGIEACKRIKADNPLVPIISLTANIMEDNLKQYRQAGFDAHMGKPFEIKDLHTLLRKYLEN